jgi:hypothetical protein
MRIAVVLLALGLLLPTASGAAPEAVPPAKHSTMHGLVAYTARSGDNWVIRADGAHRRRVTRSRGRSISIPTSRPTDASCSRTDGRPDAPRVRRAAERQAAALASVALGGRGPHRLVDAAMTAPGRAWLPLVIGSALALAVSALAARAGHGWELLWLPGVVAGAAWPRRSR